MSKIQLKMTLEISNDAKSLAEKYGYLPYIVERYLRLLGYEDTIKLLDIFENPHKISQAIRCNNRRINCGTLMNSLKELGYRLEAIEWANYSYRVTYREHDSPSLGSTHEYLKGYYYLYRDQSPLIPPTLLNVEPNSIVLDTCAAPGGKSIYMALDAYRGYVISNDISRFRLKALISHSMRMGINNIIVTWFDARKLDKLFKGKRFNKILIDVPCSAEGYIMFDPDRKRKTDLKSLEMIVNREIDILKGSLHLLESGGYAVYSTCSIAPEENELVVSEVLKHFGENIEIVKPKINLWDHGVVSFNNIDFNPDVEKCIRVWPHKHLMGGFFACVLQAV